MHIRVTLYNVGLAHAVPPTNTFSALRMQMLTKFIPIGNYSPEIRAFGTHRTSTKVFRLIIGKMF